MHHEPWNGRPVGIESQRSRQFVSCFQCGSNADLIVTAIRPYSDLRPTARFLIDDVGRTLPVVSNPFFESIDRFIGAGFRVVPSMGARRKLHSLWVALMSFMQIVRMGSQLDEAGIGHFPDLLPAEEKGAWKLSGSSVVDHFIVGGFQPACFQRQEGRIAVGFQHGINRFVKTAVSVIKRNQDGFWGECPVVFLCFQNVTDTDDGIAVFFQPVEMFLQLRL